MTYKTLPLTIRNHGHQMTQVYRSGDYAIYSKSHGFEVIRIRRHDGYNIAGNVVEPAEYAPKDEDFGNHGFYFIGTDALELAHARLKVMRAQDDRTAKAAQMKKGGVPARNDLVETPQNKDLLLKVAKTMGGRR